jgi:hypothetical protein
MPGQAQGHAPPHLAQLLLRLPQVVLQLLALVVHGAQLVVHRLQLAAQVLRGGRLGEGFLVVGVALLRGCGRAGRAG